MLYPVLILGEDIASQWIARGLKKEGFYPVFLSEFPTFRRLSYFDRENAFDELSILLDLFCAKFLSGLGSGQATCQLFLHPGLGLWAEQPDLHALAAEKKLILIAPSATQISLFSNHLQLLLLGEELGIANLLRSYNPFHSIGELEDYLLQQTGPGLKQVGYPFYLKALRASSYAGTFRVQNEADLRQGVSLWLEQLRLTEGQFLFLIEDCVDGARQFSLPFACFPHAKVQFFPIVDASLQFQHRKVQESCSALLLDQDLKQQIQASALKLLEETQFIGLGMLEYLVDGSCFFLLSASPRLTKAFILWQAVSGTEAIAWQLASLGFRLDSKPDLVLKPESEWSAGITLRIFSESSQLVLPQEGHIFVQTWQSTQGVCVDWNYPEGGLVPAYSEGWIASLTSLASSYSGALSQAALALKGLWIAGTVETNEFFLSELLSHPWVKQGIFHSSFLDQELLLSSNLSEEDFFICRQIAEALSPLGKLDGNFLINDLWLLKKNQTTIQLPASHSLSKCYPKTAVFPLHPDYWIIRIAERFFRLRRLVEKPLEEGEKRIEKTHSKRLYAQVSGRVHALLFHVGEQVGPHEPLLLLRSLNRLVPHALPKAVRLLKWSTSMGHNVLKGQELALFD